MLQSCKRRMYKSYVWTYSCLHLRQENPSKKHDSPFSVLKKECLNLGPINQFYDFSRNTRTDMHLTSCNVMLYFQILTTLQPHVAGGCRKNVDGVCFASTIVDGLRKKPHGLHNFDSCHHMIRWWTLSVLRKHMIGYVWLETLVQETQVLWSPQGTECSYFGPWHSGTLQSHNVCMKCCQSHLGTLHMGKRRRTATRLTPAEAVSPKGDVSTGGQRWTSSPEVDLLTRGGQS